MSEAALSVPSLLTIMSLTGGGMSGALHATRRNMDLMGIAVVAVCVGVGGGAIRDILLGHNLPFFLTGNVIAATFFGAFIGYFFARFVEQLGPAIFVVDSLLIGVWVVIGAEKALTQDLSISAAVFLGVTTAVGGGIIRDVLCREVPTALMPGQWVAGAAALAAVVFVVSEQVVQSPGISELLAITVATGLRVASSQFGWVTPDAVAMSRWVRAKFGLDRQPERV